MKIFLYVSYEHSMRGFVMTEYEEGNLREAAGEDGQISLAEKFFSNDIFRILWEDVSLCTEKKMLFPAMTHMIFGVRGMEGKIGNRTGYANLAVTAEMEEFDALKDLAFDLLFHFREKERELFSCLRLGGKAGYEVDEDTFSDWLKGKRSVGEEETKRVQAYRRGNLWLRLTQKERTRVTKRDCFRLGVCTGDWEDALQYLEPRWFWRRTPSGIMDGAQFASLFLGKG